MDTLTALFEWVLDVSARASLLTVAVLLIQAALRHSVSARWRYSLWLPVLIVLLMPVFPESSWSVSSITRMVPAPGSQTTVLGPEGVVNTTTVAARTPEQIVPLSGWQVLAVAWLTGAALLLLSGTAARAHMLRRFQRHCLPVGDALHREITALAGEVGLRSVPSVWSSPAIRTPAVTGSWRPVLLLPAQFEHMLAPHERRLVLKHELMHLRRGDLPVHLLVCLLLVLHWFNPLLWLAFFKSQLDREAACDAQVLEGEDQTQRVAYGHTLLKFGGACGQHRLSPGLVGIFQRGAALRSRIRSIATPPRSHPFMKLTLAPSIALLTFLGITRAATPDPEAPQFLIQAKFVEVSEKVPPSGKMAALPPPLDGSRKSPGHIATLTDPQFHTVIRTLNQRKGVDLLSAPQVVTRARQQARVEVVRQFAHKDKAGRDATESPGVSLIVTPRMKDGNRIALDVSTKAVEFMGFVDHKSKKGTWKEATFNRRKAQADVVMSPGQTLVLETDAREDTQFVQDADEHGKIISSTTEIIHRRLFAFITAHVVDPATGKPRVP